MRNVTNFPQRSERIIELCEAGFHTSQEPAAILASIQALYPNMAAEAIAGVIKVHVDVLRPRAQRRLARVHATNQILEVAARAGSPDTPIGEALKELAAAGDTDAKAILAELTPGPSAA